MRLTEYLPYCLVCVLAITQVLGCTNRGVRPEYVPPQDASASIEGGNANLASFFSEGASNIVISRIDGKGVSMGSQQVSAGVHVVSYYTMGKGYRAANGELEIAFETGRRYRLTSVLQEGDFQISLIDEAASPPEVKKTWRIPSRSRSP